MEFEPHVKVGQVLSNKKLAATFDVSTQGGMRRSLRNDCLVITTDPEAPLYKDRPFGKLFLYTGMGMKGDQDLDSGQNRTLAKSREEGTRVFLFEAQHPDYKFLGEVELAGDPSTEEQKDTSLRPRQVWIFPLRIVERSGTAEDVQELADLFPNAGRKFREGRAKMVAHMRKERNEALVKEAKARRSWVCEVCGLDFGAKYGVDYVEAHHKEPLQRATSERHSTIDDIVLVCANCHRAVHKYMAIKDKVPFGQIKLTIQKRMGEARE